MRIPFLSGNFSKDAGTGRHSPGPAENNTPCSLNHEGLDRNRHKITTPKEAVSCVKSGDRVFVGTGCAVPLTLVRALEDLDKRLEDVQIYHFMTRNGAGTGDRSNVTRFHHRSFFVDDDMRRMIEQGQGDYIPMSVAQVPELVKTGALPIDVALIQTTLPDRHGFVSLGVSVDITHAVVRTAGRVIAELNPNMPRTHGDTTISMDRIDRAILVDTPIIEHVSPRVEDFVLERIARNVARIIDHGSTLQIGHGTIPNAMLRFLSDRRDLGIHSDVITESIVDLIEKGIINGKAKTLHTGRVVASYCLGSKRLYDLIDNNPMFAFYPMETVCDPQVLRQNSKLVSVTQAEAVDLMGQVCSDQFEGRFYGGVGTQPDFMRGAAASPDGRPIICLASTTEDGKVSRIRPLLNEGEGVTIPRSDVHYVVTECGTAYLFGKSIQEKALALIETAHPSFRPWLLKEARRLKYIRQDQQLKCEIKNGHECFYPQTEDRKIQLQDRTTIVVRPTRASDVRGLQDLFYKLPPQDVYTRFFTGLKHFSVSRAEYFCNVDYERQMAFVVTIGEREQEKIIASSFYLLDQSTRMADVAYMILHEWHGKGLGTILQQRMAEYASSRGVKGFKADILPENRAMLRLAEKCGSRVTKKLSRDVYEVEMLFS